MRLKIYVAPVVVAGLLFGFGQAVHAEILEDIIEPIVEDDPEGDADDMAIELVTPDDEVLDDVGLSDEESTSDVQVDDDERHDKVTESTEQGVAETQTIEDLGQTVPVSYSEDAQVLESIPQSGVSTAWRVIQLLAVVGFMTLLAVFMKLRREA